MSLKSRIHSKSTYITYEPIFIFKLTLNLALQRCYIVSDKILKIYFYYTYICEIKQTSNSRFVLVSLIKLIVGVCWTNLFRRALFVSCAFRAKCDAVFVEKGDEILE